MNDYGLSDRQFDEIRRAAKKAAAEAPPMTDDVIAATERILRLKAYPKG